jgi:hypothetical protein
MRRVSASKTPFAHAWDSLALRTTRSCAPCQSRLEARSDVSLPGADARPVRAYSSHATCCCTSCSDGTPLAASNSMVRLAALLWCVRLLLEELTWRLALLGLVSTTALSATVATRSSSSFLPRSLDFSVELSASRRHDEDSRLSTKSSDDILGDATILALAVKAQKNTVIDCGPTVNRHAYYGFDERDSSGGRLHVGRRARHGRFALLLA